MLSPMKNREARVSSQGSAEANRAVLGRTGRWKWCERSANQVSTSLHMVGYEAMHLVMYGNAFANRKQDAARGSDKTRVQPTGEAEAFLICCLLLRAVSTAP